MNDAQIHCFYVLYRGQTEPVWFDTVDEAITYISAENVGRGLSPVTRIVATNLAFLCFGGQDRYCGMILGARTEEDQQDTLGRGEQREE
jgi:hypothetical protein